MARGRGRGAVADEGMGGGGCCGGEYARGLMGTLAGPKEFLRLFGGFEENKGRVLGMKRSAWSGLSSRKGVVKATLEVA